MVRPIKEVPTGSSRATSDPISEIMSMLDDLEGHLEIYQEKVRRAIADDKSPD